MYQHCMMFHRTKTLRAIHQLQAMRQVQQVAAKVTALGPEHLFEFPVMLSPIFSDWLQQLKTMNSLIYLGYCQVHQAGLPQLWDQQQLEAQCQHKFQSHWNLPPSCQIH